MVNIVARRGVVRGRGEALAWGGERSTAGLGLLSWWLATLSGWRVPAVGWLVVGIRGRGGVRSAERRDRAQAVEGGNERGGPWPAGLEAQSGAAAVAGEPAGGVKQPVPEPFRFGGRELTFEADELGPGEQVLGDQRGLEPGLVVLEGVVGRLRMPVSLPARMLSLTCARPR
jgi:hypothetical protein